MGRKNILLLVLALLLMAGYGCSLSIPMQSSEEENQPGTILFSDDFSDPPTGWGAWEQEGALVDYFSGGLRILVNESHFDYWSVAGKDFQDVQIEVDAIKFAGPDDNDFGILCRYQDKENFYMLVISSDGYYGIAKLNDGLYSMIGADKLQYSNAIIQGQAVNRLRADCTGTRLRLFANGEKLAEVEDVDFSSGDVGLVAGAYQITGVDILFDNFVVKVPDD